jgi:hypothetical protein
MTIVSTLGIAEIPTERFLQPSTPSPVSGITNPYPLYSASRYGDGGVVKYPNLIRQTCGTASNPCVAMPNYGYGGASAASNNSGFTYDYSQAGSEGYNYQSLCSLAATDPGMAVTAYNRAHPDREVSSATELYDACKSKGIDPQDPCAAISFLNSNGARLAPEHAKNWATACAAAKGVAPGQPARYDVETGEVTNATGEEIDPATGLPVTPWYKNPKYWLIGGAAALGLWLIAK